MRLFEIFNVFEDERIGNEYAGKVKQALDTLIGRASSENQPANYNWEFFNNLPQLQGMKFDVSLFKVLYDKYPQIANLVKNFGPKGIELKVPGVDAETEKPGTNQDNSQEKVNSIAASNAENQLKSQA
jgi:hypothetical protein